MSNVTFNQYEHVQFVITINNLSDKIMLMVVSRRWLVLLTPPPPPHPHNVQLIIIVNHLPDRSTLLLTAINRR